VEFIKFSSKNAFNQQTDKSVECVVNEKKSWKFFNKTTTFLHICHVFDSQKFGDSVAVGTVWRYLQKDNDKLFSTRITWNSMYIESDDDEEKKRENEFARLVFIDRTSNMNELNFC
jgi:hypothetical protein